MTIKRNTINTDLTILRVKLLLTYAAICVLFSWLSFTLSNSPIFAGIVTGLFTSFAFRIMEQRFATAMHQEFGAGNTNLPIGFEVVSTKNDLVGGAFDTLPYIESLLTGPVYKSVHNNQPMYFQDASLVTKGINSCWAFNGCFVEVELNSTFDSKLAIYHLKKAKTSNPPYFGEMRLNKLSVKEFEDLKDVDVYGENLELVQTVLTPSSLQSLHRLMSEHECYVSIESNMLRVGLHGLKVAKPQSLLRFNQKNHFDETAIKELSDAISDLMSVL